MCSPVGSIVLVSFSFLPFRFFIEVQSGLSRTLLLVHGMYGTLFYPGVCPMLFS